MERDAGDEVSHPTPRAGSIARPPHGARRETNDRLNSFSILRFFNGLQAGKFPFQFASRPTFSCVGAHGQPAPRPGIAGSRLWSRSRFPARIQSLAISRRLRLAVGFSPAATPATATPPFKDTDPRRYGRRESPSSAPPECGAFDPGSRRGAGRGDARAPCGGPTPGGGIFRALGHCRFPMWIGDDRR